MEDVNIEAKVILKCLFDMCWKVEKVRMHMIPSSLTIGSFCFSVMFANLLDVKLGDSGCEVSPRDSCV